MAELGQISSLASLYDPSIATDQQALERQMQLAQALRAKALEDNSGTQMAGQMAISKSPLEGIAKLLNAYVANKQDETNDTSRQALAQRTMQAMASALRQPQAGQSVQPAQAASGLPAGVTPEAMTAGGFPQPPQSSPAPEAIASALRGRQPTMDDLVRSGVIGSIAPQIAAAQAKDYETPEAIRVMQAQGLDPRVMGQLEMRAKQAAAYKMFRPGQVGGPVDEGGKFSPQFFNPIVGEGIAPSWNANGQVTNASQIPGFSGANADIKGQAAMATSAAQVHSVVDPATGITRLVRVPAPGQAQQSPQPQPQGQPTGNAPQAAQLTVTQPSQQSNDPWQTIPKRVVPAPGQGTKFEGELAGEQAKAQVETGKRLGEQAAAANDRIALNNQALGLVDRSDTGPMAARMADVKNFLVSRVGIDESRFDNTPSATISLQKDLLNAATQRAKQQFGARITQSEVMLMLSKGSPNVDMPKEAIKYLINSDNAMSKYAIQRANDYGRYTSMGGDPTQFEAWHSKTFPASQALGNVHLNVPGAQPQAQQASQQTEQAPQRGIVATGVDKTSGRRVVKYSDGTMDYAP